MPYIKKDNRILVEEIGAINSGDLNYLITKLCNDYVRRKGLCYDTINEIIGVLTCAGAEFYRRVAVPYEDKKMKENGDVY